MAADYHHFMQDIFHTIEKASEGLFKDRGSKFLAYALPISKEEDLQEHLEALRKSHPKARHFCYAYRMGNKGERYRANDDGEPSGTAGKPILGQIDRLGLTNVAVVVVRYFGGTLLGTSGLIQAYRAAAADALSQALIVEKIIEQLVRLEFPYSLMSNVLQAIKKLELDIYESEYGDYGRLDIGIPFSQTEKTLLRLKAYAGDLHLEEVEMGKEVEGLVITLLPESGA